MWLKVYTVSSLTAIIKEKYLKIFYKNNLILYMLYFEWQHR